jgi:predicted nucleic acid-binding protein
MRVLLEQARNREITLVVPEVVVQEVLKLYRARYESEVKKLTDAARRIDELGFDVSPKEIADPDTAVAVYEGELRESLHASLAVVPLPPTVSHSDVFDRALARKKPFRDSGVGYQDTLIWLNVLDEADVDNVAFITQDADFAEKAPEGLRLAADLRADLLDRGYESGRVVLYQSPRDFIGVAVESAPEQLDDLRPLLESNEFQEILAEELLVTVDRTGFDWWDEFHIVSAELETHDITNLALADIEAVKAHGFEDDDDTLVHLRAKIAMDVDFIVDRRVAEALRPDEKALIEMWGEDAAFGRKEIYAELEADVLIDAEGLPEVIDVTKVREIAASDW